MKWNDLTLKERKRIYDSVRSKNPKITYLELKDQFDNIPAYEDGVSIVNSDIDYVKWKESLPSNLRNESYGYDLYGAYKSGAIPTLYEDGYYHLPSRDSESGKILKYPSHDTFYTAITEDIKQGYYPIRKGNNTYTIPINPKEEYSIYQYKYGKESDTPSPIDYTFGTKEYFDRQQKISGNIDMVQPEAYLTPAGYLKSAIGLAEDISNGNYEDAAFDIALNSIPYGVGKILKKSNPFKYKYLANSLKSKKKLESDYDSEFSEVIRRDKNMKKYDKEVSQTIYDAVFPDETTKELIDNVDKIYGTNYKDAYKRIAMRDMTNRGKYLRYKDLGNKNGSVRSKNIVDDIEPTIDNFEVTLDPNQYLPGTGNHELGHLSDFLAKKPDTNGYLYYLLDEDNVMSPSELKKLGISINPSIQSYLLNPTEAKSHMLHLKRAMIENGNISDWSSNIDKKTLEDFLFDPKNTSVVNNMNKNQYLMYRDKNRFIERLNKLIPMELAAPLAINSNKGEE